MAREILWTYEVVMMMADEVDEILDKNDNIFLISVIISMLDKTKYPTKIWNSIFHDLSYVYPEFKERIQKSTNRIKNRIIEGAITKKYDSSFSKYLLSVCYGMTEKQIIEQTTIVRGFLDNNPFKNNNQIEEAKIVEDKPTLQLPEYIESVEPVRKKHRVAKRSEEGKIKRKKATNDKMKEYKKRYYEKKKLKEQESKKDEN